MATKKFNHTAAGNDHMSMLAVIFKKRDFQEIVADNPTLKAKRANPHILFKGDKVQPAGDQIIIIQQDDKVVTKPTDATHKFVTPVKRLRLRLRVLDDELKPLKQANFELIISGGHPPITGKTKDDGSIVESIDNSAVTGKLTVELPAVPAPAPPAPPVPPPPGPAPPAPAAPPPVKVVFDLRIGALNPILELAPDAKCLSGVQARLNNLSFPCGDADGIDTPTTQAQIKRFKSRFGIAPVDGTSNAALQTKMVDVHDRNTPIPPPPP